MTPLPPLVVFHHLWLDNPHRRHHFWSLHAYVNDARFLCNEVKTPQPYILYWICCFPCWYGPHDTCGIGRVQSTMLRFVNFCMVWYDILYVPRLILIAKILLFKIVCIQHFSVFWNLWTKLYQTKSSLNAILWKGRACVLRHRGHNGQKRQS